MFLPGVEQPRRLNKQFFPVSVEDLHKIMPKAPVSFVNPLNQALLRYDISTCERVAGYLSQLAVESVGLTRQEEGWTSKANFKLGGVNRPPHTATSKEDYFNYWYGNRPDIGNTQAGDGYKYRGRGAIQITGKTSYTQLSKATGFPLVDDPDLILEEPVVNMMASAYFFTTVKSLNPVCDFVDPRGACSVSYVNRILTHRINGGYNDLDKRLSYFKKALDVLLDKNKWLESSDFHQNAETAKGRGGFFVSI